MEKRFLGIELRSLNNAIRRYLEATGMDICRDRLTCSNAWIIGYIAKSEKEVYQRDLEDTYGITRSTVSKVVILLEKKGIISRVGVSSDARLKRLMLTEKGLDIANRLHDNMEKTEQKLTRGFTEEELEQLNSYLLRLKDNIEQTAKEENI